METIHYNHSLQWVGMDNCPSCKKSFSFWESSGMSGMSPHFYCDTCSNVLFRQKDFIDFYNGATKELLEEVRQTLPSCGCGGKFTPESNPKCPHCKKKRGQSYEMMFYLLSLDK